MASSSPTCWKCHVVQSAVSVRFCESCGAAVAKRAAPDAPPPARRAPKLDGSAPHARWTAPPFPTEFPGPALPAQAPAFVPFASAAPLPFSASVPFYPDPATYASESAPPWAPPRLGPMQPQAHPPSAVPKSLYPQANVSEGELLFTRFAHEHPRSCQGRPYSCADWVILTPHEIRRWEKIAALVQSPAGGFLRFHKSLPQGTSEEAAGQQWLRLPEERRQAWGWGVVKIIHGFPGVRTVSSPATPPAATPHTTMPATASAASNTVTVKVSTLPRPVPLGRGSGHGKGFLNATGPPMAPPQGRSVGVPSARMQMDGDSFFSPPTPAPGYEKSAEAPPSYDDIAMWS